MNDIQAFILYNRATNQNRALGLDIGLYNSIDNPTLIELLATTEVIDEAVSMEIRRGFY